MKIDIIGIIKQSFYLKNLENDEQIYPIHIEKAIQILYPDTNISSRLIAKCSSFLNMYKLNKKIPSEYNISSDYDLSDIYNIIRSLNFSKGSEDSVFYMYGLIFNKSKI